jgi:hypothetical protein
MFGQKKFAVTAAACATLALGVSVQASSMDRRYLALDQTLHANLSNAQMVMGQAQHPGSHIFMMDEPWETANTLSVGWIGSILKDHNGLYRMYYEVRGIPTPNGNARAVAVAYSNDGLNWWKPALGNNPSNSYIDDPNANIVHMATHSAMGAGGKSYQNGVVYYDANAPASQRYKMHWLGGGGRITSSADGINFTTHHHPTTSAWQWKADTGHSFFYDEIAGEWRVYGRNRNAAEWPDDTISYYNRRGVPLHSHSTFTGSWSNVGETAMDPIDFWDYAAGYDPVNKENSVGIRPDIYAGNVQTYHGQYIALPSVYFRDSQRPRPSSSPGDAYWTGTGPIYPMVMHSHDGVDWAMPDPASPGHPDHPIIDLTPHLRVDPLTTTAPTTEEVGQIYTAPNFIEVDGQILIYYVNRIGTHNDSVGHSSATHTVHVQTLRSDGFASIKANEGQNAEWLTPNDIVVPVEARGLLVNADIAGELKVEVLDSLGNVITGLSLDDSVAFTGDETGVLMKWASGQFEDVAGQEIQLRFVFDEGEIYSFSFSPIPEPASLVLMGMGAMMLLRRKRIA